MLYYLSQDTTVAASNNEHILWVRVRQHGQVCDHLLVGKLVALGALDGGVENENGAVVRRLEYKHILILGLLVMKDLVDFEVSPSWNEELADAFLASLRAVGPLCQSTVEVDFLGAIERTTKAAKYSSVQGKS